VHSLAIYDLVSDMLRKRQISALQRRTAFAAPVDAWMRLLTFEGCAVQFERALQATVLMREASPTLRRHLRDATGASLRHAVIAHEQLAAIGALAARQGIRVLVLKGAARLLGGALGGTRSIADIDVLVSPNDAQCLHRLLQTEHGHAACGPAQAHHLAPLGRPGSLTIEIHSRLTADALPLDSAIWRDTTPVSLGGATLEIPSATNLLLHTLEHAIALNWMTRYRLRDILDVAACFTSDVTSAVVNDYVCTHRQRAALETILSAAHDIQALIPLRRANAWMTVRRVSRARLALAGRSTNRHVAERLFRYVGVVAESSPATMARAAFGAARWLRSASLARVRG